MIPQLLAQTTEAACAQTSCCYYTLAGAAAAGLIVGFLIGKACGKKNGTSEKDARRMQRYAKPSNGCVEIYVGNLSYDMTEDQMRKEFEKYGKVEMARVISNRFGKSKGFGFVEMPNRPEAEKAIAALHDKEILGRKLRVNEAKNKSRE